MTTLTGGNKNTTYRTNVAEFMYLYTIVTLQKYPKGPIYVIVSFNNLCSLINTFSYNCSVSGAFFQLLQITLAKKIITIHDNYDVIWPPFKS